MNINRKISTGILIILFIFACCQGAIMHTIISSSGKKEIEMMHKDEMDKAKQKLRDYAEIAYSVVESNYENSRSNEWLQKEYGLALNKIIDIAESLINKHKALAAEGVITVDEAQRIVLKAIGMLRYNSETGYIWNKDMGQSASIILTEKDLPDSGQQLQDERAMGYVWVNDMQKPYPKMLMHPTIPELDGRILDDERFNCALGKNKNLFVAMVEVSEIHGEGYIDYIWPKPTRDGLDVEKPKLSYVRAIPEWNWIIGTGIYIDDALGKAIEKSKQDLKKMRYDEGEGYFWINDRRAPYPVMVMHPTMPELESHVMDDERFNVALGETKHLFKAFLKEAEKKDGGFVTYMWPKPTKKGLTKDEPKLSYVRVFEPFNWIIGVGVYIDSIDKLIAGKINTINATNYYLLLTILSVAIALFLLLTTASYLLIDRFFIRKINHANDELQQEIEERKKTEKKLIVARRQAESTNLTKSAFLANMSHEIRTPINAVLGLAHLLKQTNLTDQQQDYIQKLTLSADNLLSVINDILDISKVEAGKLELESVRFNLHTDVLHNVVQVVGLAANEKGLEMMVDLEPNIPDQLVGDPDRLRQILINLMNNAVKFTDHGEVTLAVSTLKSGAKGVLLKFEVHDTGIGITEEEQKKLFTAFAQADTSITRQFGGTGLGLTISKTLTNLMKGEIGLSSLPGKGSTFWFSARFDLDSQAEQRPFAQVCDDLRGKRILVVDDNQTSRLILTRQLKSLGFAVTAAKSGEEALVMLQESVTSPPFDLILIDWKMPEMDGVETTRQIRTKTGLEHIPPIILLATYDRKGLEEKARDVEFNEILIKPIFPSALHDAITATFGMKIGVSIESDSERLPEHVNGARVLLVEDNTINQEVACAVLEKAGLLVVVAENGLQALKQLKQAQKNDTPFDVVLMDIQMPVMDGYTTAREIRRQPFFENLPVIAMTANAMAGDRQKALDAGMNDHIAKPILMPQLFKILGQWVHVPEEQQGAAPGRHQKNPEQFQALEVLPEIPCLNMDSGLNLIGGDIFLYQKLLKEFKRNYNDYSAKISTAITQKDYAAAEYLAHALKGVAGIIGAKSLSEASDTLEMNLRANDPERIEKSVPSCLEELKKLLLELQKAFPEESVNNEASSPFPRPEPPADSYLQALKTLRDYLLDDDSEAIEYFIEKKELLAGTIAPDELKKMEERLRKYEFREVLIMLPSLTRPGW